MTAPGARSRVSLWLDLIRWDRPAGTWLLLWPTLAALWIAAEGFPGWHLLVVFVVGTFLMRSAGCAANDDILRARTLEPRGVDQDVEGDCESQQCRCAEIDQEGEQRDRSGEEDYREL